MVRRGILGEATKTVKTVVFAYKYAQQVYQNVQIDNLSKTVQFFQFEFQSPETLKSSCSQNQILLICFDV